MSSDDQITEGFGSTFGEACDWILENISSAPKKGQTFERLLVHVLPEIRETEIIEAWRWADVPEDIRKRVLPRGTRADVGIDILAKRNDGSLIAIQAKCYKKDRSLPKDDVNSFLATTGGNKEIAHRWVVATCKWTRNLLKSTPNCTFIHAPTYWGHFKFDKAEKPISHDLDTLQTEAFYECTEGLKKHDRGQLIMACGTGKTLVSQRIAEDMVPTGGLVIYATPSIGLTAQSRREWLREARRPIRTVVVCSDATVGENDGETGYTCEVEAPVSTDPARILNAVKKAQKHNMSGGGATLLFSRRISPWTRYAQLRQRECLTQTL